MSKDVKTTRRAILAGAVATVPAVAIAPRIAAAGPDPIFAAIEKLQRLNAEEDAVSIDIDRAEEAIRRKLPPYPHGYRPSGLIEWRSYSAISGDEIDRAREEFIQDKVADIETIEQDTGKRSVSIVLRCEPAESGTGNMGWLRCVLASTGLSAHTLPPQRNYQTSCQPRLRARTL